MQIALPVNKPTACTFGGSKLDQLFVTTRIENGPDAAKDWGSILSIKIPGVVGAAAAYEVDLTA